MADIVIKLKKNAQRAQVYIFKSKTKRCLVYTDTGELSDMEQTRTWFDDLCQIWFNNLFQLMFVVSWTVFPKFAYILSPRIYEWYRMC